MPEKCAYCGNNRVPHFIYWYQESLNILLTPLRQFLLYNFLTKKIKGLNFGQKSAGFFFKLGKILGIITLQTSKDKCKVRRAQVLWEEAEKRGIKMSELLLFGRPFDVYAAEKLGGRILFSGLPRPSESDNHLLDLIDDKGRFKKIMMQNNLPVPMGGSAATMAGALKIFRQIQKTANSSKPTAVSQQQSADSCLPPGVPVIVKPRSGSRGRHSATFVYNIEELKKAVRIAKQLCHWVIVEEQLFGPVYRATIINFKLCGVLRGDSPQVTGDGRRNISQLVADKNFRPRLGVKDIVIDKTAEKFLQRQNLNLLSVIEKDRVVSLSEKIGVNYGGSSSEDLEICHPDNKNLFERAAKVLGDPVLGFDFIIPDIAKSYKEQKCGFIEVNTLPFINLHHDPLFGRPQNVAAKVWDMMGW